MAFLLDTNVVSEPRRKRPSDRVLAWLEAQHLKDAYLSVITIGEIEQGIARLSDQQRARQFQEWLELSHSTKDNMTLTS